MIYYVQLQIKLVLLPSDAISLAKVRMVQSLTFNELLPAVMKLLTLNANLSQDAEDLSVCLSESN